MTVAVERALQALDSEISGWRKSSHHTAQEFPKAVAMFVGLFESGERPHPDDVKHWAQAHGWSDEHARDLGEMADTVYYTMKELDRI